MTDSNEPRWIEDDQADSYEEGDDVGLRMRGARAAKSLIEAAKREPDVREMLAMLCSRLGKSSIVELADADPEMVIQVAAEVESLVEQEIRFEK